MNTIALKNFKEKVEEKLIGKNQFCEGLVFELNTKDSYSLVMYQKENQTYRGELISIFYEEHFVGMDLLERLKTLTIIALISGGTKDFKIRKNMVPFFFANLY